MKNKCHFMEFIGLLSKGKGTWGQVIGLIKREDWDSIFVIGDIYAKKMLQSFNLEKDIKFIEIDTRKKIRELIKEIQEKLKDKIKGTEVALSIASGDGKEHMAIISALLNLPVGIKFAVLTKEGTIFL